MNSTRHCRCVDFLWHRSSAIDRSGHKIPAAANAEQFAVVRGSRCPDCSRIETWSRQNANRTACKSRLRFRFLRHRWSCSEIRPLKASLCFAVSETDVRLFRCQSTSEISLARPVSRVKCATARRCGGMVDATNLKIAVLAILAFQNRSNRTEFAWVNREIRKFLLRVRGASKKELILAQILHTDAADFGFEIVSRSEFLPFLCKISCTKLAQPTQRISGPIR